MSLTEPPLALPGRTRTRRMIIVAENEESHREHLAIILGTMESDFIFARDMSDLLELLQQHPGATALLAPGFCDRGALSAVGLMHLNGYCPRVILITDSEPSESGLSDVEEQFHHRVRRTVSGDEFKRSLTAAMRSRDRRPPPGTPMIGASAAIKELRDTVTHVAETDAAVMIIGESGTGKELVAQAIHSCSHRAPANFVPVNMAALPDSLVESVLFGHEKGAFTGAESRQSGLCQYAHGGTLFLDEISEMHHGLQPKLLRFLQTGTINRVGSPRSEMVDARIVSATNRTVEELIGRGALREDVFFRLHVIPIHVPPLRERTEDIPMLAGAFLKRAAGRRRLSFSPECLDLFCSYSWPGNIRQLENVVARMAVMTKGDVIEATHFRAERRSLNGSAKTERSAGDGKSDTNGSIASIEPQTIGERTLTRMESAERQLIIEALQRTGGSASRAAEFLGVGTATIYRKIRLLEIPKSGTGGNADDVNDSAHSD